MDGRPTACRFSMPQKNPKNFKTGLILASIALVFFSWPGSEKDVV